jgi:predicted aspartyl protease
MFAMSPYAFSLLFAVLVTCSAAAAGSGAPVPQPPSSAATIVALKPFGTQPAVEVLVNGRGPYLFLVDTGASGVARIDSSVVAELRLPRVGEATGVGAMGQQGVLTRVKVETLQVGKETFRELTPLSRSYNVEGEYLPNIGGILALNLFEDRLLTIDFPNRQLRIERGALPAADGRTILEYEPRGNLVYVPIRIGGVALTAEVDTGNDRALDLPTDVIRKLRLRSFPRPLGRAEGLGATIPLAEVRLADELAIGSHRVAEPLVTFSEGFEHPILGSSFLQDYVVTIDQRNRRLRLVRARRRPKPQ